MPYTVEHNLSALAVILETAETVCDEQQALPDIEAKVQVGVLSLDQSNEGRKYLKNVDADKLIAKEDSDYDIIRHLKLALERPIKGVLSG